jgi:D-3-phosphoglycerate dehydrogenase
MGQRYRGLVDKKFLAEMKTTAYLVNTSRGPVIKEGDLIYALENDVIADAALDVYENEPLQESNPLSFLPNTVLTSHQGFKLTAVGRTYIQSV